MDYRKYLQGEYVQPALFGIGLSFFLSAAIYGMDEVSGTQLCKEESEIPGIVTTPKYSG